MRILLVNHFPLTGSGSGVYTANIANSLIKLGHEVSAVFPENQPINEKYAFKTSPVYFTNTDQSTETTPSSKTALPFNFPCFTTHPRSTFTFEEMTNNELDAYASGFRSTIKNEIQSFKPDILHCGHIWILADVCTEFRLPVVVTSHGTDLMGIQNSPKLANHGMNVAQKCDAIISISKGNFEQLEAVLPQYKEKFYLITNGYNSDIFYPTNASRKDVLCAYSINEKYEHVISFAGKFAHFKGIDVLLKANALYDRDDTATILAGDGELYEDMTKLKEKLDLKNTYFVHNQPHEKLRQLYSIADASLVPSRNEPFGLVAIEAGACGAPIIASKSGGLLDIVKLATGLFFEQENYEELANCVKKVIDGRVSFDRELISKETYNNFSQDIFTNKLIDQVYSKLLS